MFRLRAYRGSWSAPFDVTVQIEFTLTEDSMTHLAWRDAIRDVALLLLGTVIAISTVAAPANAGRRDDDDDRDEAFTTEFGFADCRFADTGRNRYFVLEPGYRWLLEGRDADGLGRLQIDVLHETRRIGDVNTRVVRERHFTNGELVEESRNYFAICTRTNSAIYFGEDVDIYENGRIVRHDGAWLHGRDGAKAGVMMPGLPLLGGRYYQEVAPGVALDRAEIVRDSVTMRTPAGRFTGVLKVRETTPLEPGAVSIKHYAPGIGLIADGALELVSHGP
jgi:hypothetical protein